LVSRIAFASEPSLDHGDADAGGHQGQAAPGRGGLRPSLTAASISVVWVSGRGEETALSRTRKLTGEVILGRYCPLETARRRLELASGRGKNEQPIVTVASIDPTGTAADSGIQKGDIIVEVQGIPVSEADTALRIFREQSLLKHRFAAVLVRHDKKPFWMSLAIPE
jgi:membrane-associated protease RseP (regulator of RpoE activity)